VSRPEVPVIPFSSLNPDVWERLQATEKGSKLLLYMPKAPGESLAELLKKDFTSNYMMMLYFVIGIDIARLHSCGGSDLMFASVLHSDLSPSNIYMDLLVLHPILFGLFEARNYPGFLVWYTRGGTAVRLIDHEYAQVGGLRDRDILSFCRHCFGCVVCALKRGNQNEIDAAKSLCSARISAFMTGYYLVLGWGLGKGMGLITPLSVDEFESWLFAVARLEEKQSSFGSIIRNVFEPFLTKDPRFLTEDPHSSTVSHIVAPIR
jgi:hypothetical protein